jgi:16S rRNA (cytidine1402-2'-O)-methyltransferase
MTSILYLVATPIGNLADITYRAIDTLKNCDYILCEDTRHSRILLQHYEIQKPLKSYHKFNESAENEKIIQDLKEGKIICLISDAGTPCVSDPGNSLVQSCIRENIAVIAIPGPCAVVQAYICSGFETNRFQFCGFLPKKEQELGIALQKIFDYDGTSICYEAPHRILDLLTAIEKIDPERSLVLARELTKKFEQFLRGNAPELLKHFAEQEPRGEFVVVIGPPEKEKIPDWSQWTPEEHVKWIEKTYSLNKKESLKLVAQLRGIPKRELYKELNN